MANRIHILKDIDANHPPVKTYKQCASDHGISEPTITNVVRKFVSEGLDATIKLKRSVSSDNAQRKVDGRVEVKLLEVVCGSVPKGHSRWTLRLLEAQMKMILDESISREVIRRTLNKLRPHRSYYWCPPKKEDPEFIACMEDILDVYAFPYNPKVPVVCMDKKPYQLLGEVRDSGTMRLGDNKKLDSEYVRKGTCSIFDFVKPLGGRHHTSVKENTELQLTGLKKSNIWLMRCTLKPRRSFLSWTILIRISHLHYIRLSSQSKHVESSRSLRFTIFPAW